ncbi:HTTM domain-containing protein [Mangrovicoccus algicola]|uniref:HTTM domain-containing protein n=1 Tax=Mangrovicoccus algicola TaxID=2771008 RepID=A0A8J6YPH8_9RHOB|nr:HTTM domain-containing protein [Mangrovicoccus algicola]MBE3637008.1 HTTM domain-containing protein [Mangrovicoccus algicola]
MSLAAAQGWAELLIALALLQASAEHLAHRGGRGLHLWRAGLCLLLILGQGTEAVALAGLCLCAVLLLHRWRGPYNGGADRMAVLILFCLATARICPPAAELAMGYLAVQTVLSYLVSGWVKIVNPDWRNGRALSDVFRISAYPAAEELRALAARPRLLRAGGWAVMGLELLFPLALLSGSLLAAALAATALFHLANACLFGLNRFLWTWPAAYPALLWLQARLIG